MVTYSPTDTWLAGAERNRIKQTQAMRSAGVTPVDENRPLKTNCFSEGLLAHTLLRFLDNQLQPTPIIS